jgi:3-deoxy-manno-octulosonate cytidylyltransferase (CMP-KDO synthetase)
MGTSVIAIIPARYESTRLPGKPLALIDGRPMIQHVYERTAAVPGIDRVIVATDDARIRDAVARCGGEAFMTSSAHVSGTDRIAEVARGLDADVVVNVQGDLPFLDADMVIAALAPLRHDPTLGMATLKTPIRSREEWENPNVVKVVTDRRGMALYFSRCPIPFHRDGAGDGFGDRHIGLYAYRRDFLLTFAGLTPTPLEQHERLEQLRALENGYPIKVEDVTTAAVEVDTPQDLERARALAQSRG